MKVLKFGGSSLANSNYLKKVAEIIRDKRKKGENLTVVVSAMGKSTDNLVKMAGLASKGNSSYKNLFASYKEYHLLAVEDLFGANSREIKIQLLEWFENMDKLLYGVFLLMEASPRTMDYHLSFGERMSAFILTSYLNHLGLSASYVDAREIIITDKAFGAANVYVDITYEKIKERVESDQNIKIITGFISSDKGGLTTTLGRGGSDYTAALISAAIQADCTEIWTDVDGVLTADPTRVKKAFSIPNMTYSEAVEMSHFGARVIYPPTIQPLMERKIPIYIKNTFNPDHPGTCISDQPSQYKKSVKGISSINNISLLTLQGSGMFGVPGIAARLFQSLAQANINIILITQGSSENNISFAVQPENTAKAKKMVEQAFELEMKQHSIEPVKLEKNLSVIAIIGENMRFTPGIAGKMMSSLGKNGINAIAIAQGSSERNISVVIEKSNETKALIGLHQDFFLSETKVLHVFMIGVGLIGSTLIDQITEQTEYLKKNRSIEIKIVGLANTKKMILQREGIDISDWKSKLYNTKQESNIEHFVKEMLKYNLPNSVFVDNTASPELPKFYEKILSASISISTPNKVATSSDFQGYSQLKALARKHNAFFGYETNVGAGLPVISTLRNLIDSGDRIIKIEGVLSGSLSFIFNTFSKDQPFSEVVGLAKEKGYTEPDPREDLSGSDVKRKILILAREVGLSLEGKEVGVEQLLPDSVLNAKSIKAFFDKLPAVDEEFLRRAEAAENAEKKLRFIASLVDNKASINLQSVGSDNPFYHLSGSDNMIIFTTERYKDRPLVVQGPGAGAAVTAAGVFAEIIQTANTSF